MHPGWQKPPEMAENKGMDWHHEGVSRETLYFQGKTGGSRGFQPA